MKKLLICKACFYCAKSNEEHYIGVLGKTKCNGEFKLYVSMDDISGYIQNIIDKIEDKYPDNEPFNLTDGSVYVEICDLEKEMRK